MSRSAHLPPRRAARVGLALLGLVVTTVLPTSAARVQRAGPDGDARSRERARQALVTQVARQLGLAGRTKEDEGLVEALGDHVREQFEDPHAGIREAPAEVREWLDERRVAFEQLARRPTGSRRSGRGGLERTIPADLAASTHAAVHAAVLEAARTGRDEHAARLLAFARRLVPEPEHDLGLRRLRDHVDLVRQLERPPARALEELAELRRDLRGDLFAARRLSLAGGPAQLAELEPCRPERVLAKAGSDWGWWPDALDAEARIELALLGARLRALPEARLRELARAGDLAGLVDVPCSERWRLEETRPGRFELSLARPVPHDGRPHDPPPLQLVLGG